MKMLKGLGWKTAALMLAGTGVAAAATSGLPIDGPVNTFVNFLSTDVAIGSIGAGAAGWAYHAASGRDLGFLTNHAGGFIVGGAGLSAVQPLSAGLGMSAGATLGHDIYATHAAMLYLTNAILIGGLGL